MRYTVSPGSTTESALIVLHGRKRKGEARKKRQDLGKIEEGWASKRRVDIGSDI